MCARVRVYVCICVCVRVCIIQRKYNSTRGDRPSRRRFLRCVEIFLRNFHRYRGSWRSLARKICGITRLRPPSRTFSARVVARHATSSRFSQRSTAVSKQHTREFLRPWESLECERDRRSGRERDRDRAAGKGREENERAGRARGRGRIGKAAGERTTGAEEGARMVGGRVNKVHMVT